MVLVQAPSLAISLRSRRIVSRAASLAIVWLLMLAASAAVAQVKLIALWREVATCTPDEVTPRTISCIVVDVDPKRLSPDTPAVSVSLPDKTRQKLVRRRSALAADGFVWEGIGATGWRATFSVVKSAIVGEIIAPRGRVFRLRFAPTGRYPVEELIVPLLDSAYDTTEPRPPPGMAPAPPCTDPWNRVDVMVIFTRRAVQASGTENHLRAEINNAVWDTNWAFIDSALLDNGRLLDLQINLVHAEQVSSNYDEGATPVPFDNASILAQLEAKDPLLDDGTLRDKFKADIVVLVTDPQVIGYANTLTSSNPTLAAAFESRAFAVVPQGGLSAAGNYGFAHEVGHVMGSTHQSGSGAYSYSHAHTSCPTGTCSTGWMTIMASGCPCPLTVVAGKLTCPCGRIREWSNPRLRAGVANHEDNALSLDGTREWVSNFRCGKPIPNNVWMRDTWDDTGAEPDPAQATAPMWMSPYIWVRNAQDPSPQFQHQHDHENPLSGRTNWVYVKLHNTGPTMSGNLELYYANASTNLTWQTRWTQLSSQAISSFNANSTRIVEFPWNNVPGPGHFCLVARWNSTSDPMRTPEGPDIGANARANNNIVWRNLHIVALTNLASSEVDLGVGNADDQPARFEFEIRAPANSQGRSFLAFGKLTVRLDESTARSLRVRGAKASGFRAIDKRTYLVGRSGAVLSGLSLDSQSRGQLHLTFQRPSGRRYPAGAFRVDVTQTQIADGLRSLVGAVSYEVRTGR